LKITLSLQPLIELPMVATKMALDSRLWIFFDAIFKRRSVLGAFWQAASVDMCLDAINVGHVVV